MKLTVLIFSVVLLQNAFSFSNINKLLMIRDVITAYEQPTDVVAKVCWKASYKTKLATILANGRPIKIRYATENYIFSNEIYSNHLLFLIDLNCPASKYFLHQVNENKMFSKTYRWLVIGNNNDSFKKFDNLNILVDSEFIVAKAQKDEKFLLNAVYSIQPKGEWITEYYGTWTASNGLNKSVNRTISNAMRRKNLNGTAIPVSLVITDNRTVIDYAVLSNIFVDPATKSTFQTLLRLYDFINATKEVIFSGSWGYLVNGSWTGMTKDIDLGKADLCGCITFINNDRLNVLEYLMFPTSTPMAKIVFRQPPLSYQYNLFVLPFTPGVWYCLCGFFVVICIVLYINTKWDMKKYEKVDKKRIDQSCLNATWGDIILFNLSAVSQQGSTNELKGTLGRLVMFLIFLSFVFFYTSYSANIVVLLQSTSNQIRTIADLTNSKLELGIEDVVYNKYYFTESFARDPVRKAFYETKVAPKGSKPNYLSLEEGIKKLQTEPFAFNMNTGSGYRIVSQYFQEYEKCGLLEIDYIQGSKPWFCSKKKSPYNEIYRVGFIRIEEHGLSDRNNRIIFAKKPTCTVSGGNFGSVNMMDFYPVLITLLYGMILALVLFVLEILVHRRQQKNIKAKRSV